ncbi:MAG TPA: amidohydrolase family protein [Vicinamibacterales bacterium]|jgi:imidazolonepropionase-like amidohydrolase|nr:amidohydrolase family protein [Vicinamibacterales bacterium]
MSRVCASCLLSLAIAAPAAAQTIALTGAKVFPVSQPPIENATVVIVRGKITAVGANVPIPANAERIDARGRWITPGLIDPVTVLGVVEIGAVPQSNDASAKGDKSVAAAFRVWDALNPASMLWAPTRNEGVTTVGVVPSGGLVAGQAAVVDLVDGTASQMLRRKAVAVVAQLQSGAAPDTSSRGEVLLRLRELLQDAKVYATHRPAYDTARTRAFATTRPNLDALVPVVTGQTPLMLSVDRAADIGSALDLAHDFALKIILNGAGEGWMLADRIAAAHVPVVTGALDNIPSSFSTLGARQENAALLRKAGVAVALSTGGDAFNVRNLKQHAGNAVAYGLSWDDALRAVTLTPAEILGVAANVGTLQPGRDANLVVWDGDPFEFSTHAVRVLVHGREIHQASRQDLLMERYKSVPPVYIKQP